MENFFQHIASQNSYLFSFLWALFLQLPAIFWTQSPWLFPGLGTGGRLVASPCACFWHSMKLAVHEDWWMSWVNVNTKVKNESQTQSLQSWLADVCQSIWASTGELENTNKSLHFNFRSFHRGRKGRKVIVLLQGIRSGVLADLHTQK